MSYNTRIFTSSKDQFGRSFTVRIKEKDFTGSAQQVPASAVPFTIEQGRRGGDIFDEIRGTEISYYPYAMTSGEFDFILDGNETDFKIQVDILGLPSDFINSVIADNGLIASDSHTKDIFNQFDGASVVCPMSAGADSKLYFNNDKANERYEGFVYVDLYNEDGNVFPRTVAIRGGDGLGRLSDIDYDIQSERQTFIEIADRCLKASGQDLDIAVSDSIKEDMMDGTGAWGQQQADDREFRDRNREPFDCATVLRELLKSKLCSITQATTNTGDLVWFIYSRDTLDDTTITADLYVDGVGNGTVTIPGKINADTALTGVTLERERAPRRISRVYDHGQGARNIVENGDFTEPGEEQDEAFGWTFEDNDAEVKRSQGLPDSPTMFPQEGSHAMTISYVDGTAGEATADSFFFLETPGADFNVQVSIGYYLRVVLGAGPTPPIQDDRFGGLRLTLEADGQTDQVYNFDTEQWENDTGQLSAKLRASNTQVNKWVSFERETADIPFAGRLQLKIIGPSGEQPHPNVNFVRQWYDDINTRLALTTDFPRDIAAESSLFRISRVTDSSAKIDEQQTIIGDGPMGIHPSTISVDNVVTSEWGPQNEFLELAVLRKQLAQIRNENEVLTATLVQQVPVYRGIEYKGKTYIPNYLYVQDAKRGYYRVEMEEYQFNDSGLSTQLIEQFPEEPTERRAVSEGGQGGEPVGGVETFDGLQGDVETDIDGVEGIEFSGSVIDGGEIKLEDEGVTEAKLADDSVSTNKVQDDAIIEAKLSDDSVSTDKVQDNAVTLAKVPFADQDLNKTDTPIFTQTLLDNEGTNDFNAVRADRELRLLADDDSVVSWNPSTAQNLTGDRNFKPTFVDASTTQRGLLGTGSQSIGGDKTFHDDVKLVDNSELISDAEFESGFGGVGFRHSRVNSRWKFETDDLLVRGALFAYEFIIKQVSAINGSDILSAGVGTVEEIVFSAPGEYTVKVSDATGNNISPFVAGDILLIQQVNPDVYNETPTAGQIVKRVVGTVGSVTDNQINVQTDQGTLGTDVELGDIMVVIGSSVSERQNLIHRSVIEENAPFTRVLSGVDSIAGFTDMSNTIVQYGNLDSLSSEFSEVSGNGMFVKDRFYARIGDNNVMQLGRDAGNVGQHGIKISDNDFWYGDKTASFFGGLLQGDGDAEEAQIARLEIRSNRIFYQSKDVTDVPLPNTFSGFAASDQTSTEPFARPSFFTGAQSDGASDARNAKVRIWPDGRIDAADGKFQALTDGRIIHESITANYFEAFNRASFGVSDAESDRFSVSNFYGIQIVEEIPGLYTKEKRKLSAKFFHRFGVNKININGLFLTSTDPAPNMKEKYKIRVLVLDFALSTKIDETFDLNLSGEQVEVKNVEIDASSLDDDEYYTIELYLRIEAESDSAFDIKLELEQGVSITGIT